MSDIFLREGSLLAIHVFGPRGISTIFALLGIPLVSLGDIVSRFWPDEVARGEMRQESWLLGTLDLHHHYSPTLPPTCC